MMIGIPGNVSIGEFTVESIVESVEFETALAVVDVLVVGEGVRINEPVQQEAQSHKVEGLFAGQHCTLANCVVIYYCLVVSMYTLCTNYFYYVCM